MDDQLTIRRGGISGCVAAARLAEQSGVTVLLIEAGPPNEGVEDSYMAGGFVHFLFCQTGPSLLPSKNKLMVTNNYLSRWNALLEGPHDWNIASEPTPGINERKIKLSKGRILGGSSGLNGTLCIRGSQQDYDDWHSDGWGGDEFFGYMMKVWCLSGLRLKLLPLAFLAPC
jgi:choline dehydrogenase-like flavoprotein